MDEIERAIMIAAGRGVENTAQTLSDAATGGEIARQKLDTDLYEAMAQAVPNNVLPQQSRLPGISSAGAPLERTPGVPLVQIKALHAETGWLDDFSIEGNNADGETPTESGLVRADAYGVLYDEYSNTWNRERGNQSLILLERQQINVPGSHVSSGVMWNYNARGGHFVITVDAIAVGVSLQPVIYGVQEGEIQGGNPNNIALYEILRGSAITATGCTVLKVYPGITAIANAATSDILPRKFYFSIFQTGAGNVYLTSSVNLVL